MQTLLVDNGGSFANDRITHGALRADAVVQNEWVLKAHSKYNVEVMNLSANELGTMVSFLRKDDFAARSASLPILKRVVSSNFVSESPNLVAPQSFIVRRVPQAGDKPLRVAFIGLCEMTNDPPVGIKITDPIAAAKRVLPEARQQADIVIALAHLSAAEAARLAREVPGFDAIITGTGDMFTPPIRVNGTLIAFNQYETKFIGELRFYKDEQGKYSVRERYISLDPGVGDDAEALKFVKEAKEGRLAGVQAVEKAFSFGFNVEAKRPKWDPATYKPAEGERPVFISSQACAQCHAEQYLKWVNSTHARATEPISLKKELGDLSCFQCHSTGVQKAGELPKLDNVQCEQCHGAGSLHAIKPAKGYGKVADLKAMCTSCHNQKTSPDFDLQNAWLKIKH